MPYSSHNLMQGDRLTEKTLQDIDNQCAWQDSQLTQMIERIEATSKTLDELILQNLSIDADQENVYLYYNGEQISEAALTADASGVVPCTALSYSSNAPVQIVTGGAGQSVAPTKQPANCNQPVRYYSDAPGKINVSAAGVVTATDACRAKIHAVCGMQKVSRDIVSTKAIPVNDMYICGYPYWSNGGYLMISSASNSDYDTINIGFEDGEDVDSYIEVPQGYTVQVTLSDSDDTYAVWISMLGLLFPNTESRYTGDDRITDHFGFDLTVWNPDTSSPIRVFRSCTCIATAKSAAGASAGGNDTSWPGYTLYESDSLKNDTGKTGFLIVSFRLKDRVSGDRVQPTQAIINKIVASGCIDIQLLPEEEYVPVKAMEFTVTPSKAVAGATLEEITLAFAASRQPASAAITHYAANAGAEKAMNIGVVSALQNVSLEISDCEIKTTRVFDLFLSDEGGGVDKKTAILEFLNYAYYGIAAIPEEYDSAWVTALDKKLVGTAIGGYEMPWESWSEGYVHIALPQRLVADRTLVFKNGTATLTFTQVAMLNVTNENDFVEQYAVYRNSAEQTTGLTLVVR